jgi:hypothetical protein
MDFEEDGNADINRYERWPMMKTNQGRSSKKMKERERESEVSKEMDAWRFGGEENYQQHEMKIESVEEANGAIYMT